MINDHMINPCKICSACENAIKTDSFTSTTTQKTFKIKETITCSSSFVIYLISCPCGLQYIGKTNRQLKIRINEHGRMDIHSPVERHFADVDHKLRDFQAFRD